MRDGRAALLCVLLAACSYDWTPGSGATPEDAGHDADAGLVDGHDGAAATDAPAVDATGQDATGPSDAVVDVVGEPDCAALQNAVQAALPGALYCKGTPPPDPTACTTAVQDPCGCTLYVGEPGAAVTDYQNAVKALKDSGCTIACGTCPATQKGLCIISDAGGQQYACYY